MAAEFHQRQPDAEPGVDGCMVIRPAPGQVTGRAKLTGNRLNQFGWRPVLRPVRKRCGASAPHMDVPPTDVMEPSSAPYSTMDQEHAVQTETDTAGDNRRGLAVTS